MNKSEKEMYKLMLGEEFSVMKKEEDDLNPFLDNWRILNLQNKIDLLKELKGYSDLTHMNQAGEKT
jgi:hypothetical protein